MKLDILAEGKLTSNSLLLFVLEWSFCRAISCPPPLPIPLQYTKLSQIKHRLT